MNTKPGDLAIVVREGPYLGCMVEVLRYVGTFTCLNGDTADDCVYVRSLGSFRFSYGPVERETYKDEGVFRDSSLRPLRGEPEREQHDEEIAA